jgi:hypothetical protein
MKVRSIASVATLVAAQIVMTVQSAHAGAVSVPEPASLTLLGTGAAVVAIGVWWKNRK